MQNNENSKGLVFPCYIDQDRCLYYNRSYIKSCWVRKSLTPGQSFAITVFFIICRMETHVLTEDCHGLQGIFNLNNPPREPLHDTKADEIVVQDEVTSTGFIPNTKTPPHSFREAPVMPLTVHRKCCCHMEGCNAG